MKDVTSYDEEPKKSKQLDVYPIKKGKRFLLYISDLIIAFFFAFFLYSTAVVPLSRVALAVDERQADSAAARVERNKVLIENKVLYSEYVTQPLENQMLYTAKEYAKYYSGVTPIVDKPDIFVTYYFEIKTNYKNKYWIAVEESNAQGMFEIDKTDPNNFALSLKEPYKSDFFDGLSEGGSFTPEGNSEFNKFYNSFFLNMYASMLLDIRTYDLFSTTNLRSYNTCQQVINEYEIFFKNVVVADTYISFGLGIAICYILVPMVTKNRKTLAMLFMRVEKVNRNDLELKSRLSIFVSLAYNVATNLLFVFFIPLGSLDMSSIFNLPTIVPISLVSLGIAIISLFFLLFDEYNRPLSDRFNNTVTISSDTLDEIYRARGYDV